MLYKFWLKLTGKTPKTFSEHATCAWAFSRMGMVDLYALKPDGTVALKYDTTSVMQSNAVDRFKMNMQVAGYGVNRVDTERSWTFMKEIIQFRKIS